MLTDGALVLCILLFMHEIREDWMKEWQDAKILATLQRIRDYSHLQFPFFSMVA